MGSPLAIFTPEFARQVQIAVRRVLNLRVIGGRIEAGEQSMSIYIPTPAGNFGGQSSLFTAWLTSATRDGTNWRWTYAFAELEKTAAGWTGYSVKPSGRSGTAYNRNEYANLGTAGTTLGNGVKVNDLPTSPATFAPQPIPLNRPVTIQEEVLTTGAVEYWIVAAGAENGISGGCS